MNPSNPSNPERFCLVCGADAGVGYTWLSGRCLCVDVGVEFARIMADPKATQRFQEEEARRAEMRERVQAYARIDADNARRNRKRS